MRKNKPLVSIIILNFNGLKDSIECLNSLKKTKFKNYEVILIDNGSEKNEAQILRKKFPNYIRAYKLTRNLGFTGGNNWALKKTYGKYIVLLNNDTKVDPEWLKPLVKLMESDKKIAVVQPKILQMSKKTHFDYAGAAGGIIDKYGYPFTRGRIFETIEKDRGQYDGISRIFWASGSACIIRKAIIRKVGGLFSENLFNYMEEIDFCWRTQNAGYKVLFTSDSVIYHKGASTSKKNLVKKRFWEHRNNLFIVTRNLDLLKLIKILPFRFLLEMLTYLKYLFFGNRKYIKSLLLAHLDYFRKSFLIRYKRKRLPNKDNLPIYPGSIVTDYFLKNIKNFKKLNWSPKGNIAYVLYDTKVSGGVKVIFQQAVELKKRGYGVTIYKIFGDVTNVVKVIKFKSILNLFLDSNDVLVATFWPTSYLVYLAKAQDKYFLIMDWEDLFDMNKLTNILGRYSYDLKLKRITISNFLRKKILAASTDKSDVKVQRLPINLEKFTPGKSKTDKRQDVIKVISILSWYTKYKRPDLLVRTVKNIRNNSKTKIKFSLVSREQKPYKRVFDSFHSNISEKNLIKKIKSSDILLCTSRAEGLFLPGLEAMACGCLFITTDSGGVQDYAVNGYNSIIVTKVEDLWEKNLIENLYKNVKLRKKMINNGFKTAKRYNINSVMDQVESIYFANLA